MAYHFIKIPAPVELRHPNGTSAGSWGMKELHDRLMENPLWQQSFSAIRSALAIEEAMKDAQPGDVVKLADEDWARYKACVETPRRVVATQMGLVTEENLGFYPVTAATQIIPLLAAIVDATSAELK